MSEYLKRLRQSIVTWAFEGKLVDQDPNDDTASDFLDRIRAQRKVVVSSSKPRRGKSER